MQPGPDMANNKQNNQSQAGPVSKIYNNNKNKKKKKKKKKW
jgi:hypothetical protein